MNFSTVSDLLAYLLKWIIELFENIKYAFSKIDEHAAAIEAATADDK